MCCRRTLDEEVARLHLDALGVKLTTMSPEQADYLGVPVGGPLQARSLPLLVESSCLLSNWQFCSRPRSAVDSPDDFM